MNKKASNRDIAREFLTEQYRHESPEEIIGEAVNFLIESLYKFDPPQVLLDEVEAQAKISLNENLSLLIKSVIDRS